MGKAGRKHSAEIDADKTEPTAADLPDTISVPLEEIERFWAEHGLTPPDIDAAEIERARRIMDREASAPLRIEKLLGKLVAAALTPEQKKKPTRKRKTRATTTTDDRHRGWKRDLAKTLILKHCSHDEIARLGPVAIHHRISNQYKSDTDTECPFEVDVTRLAIKDMLTK